jgi:hypothetical protein
MVRIGCLIIGLLVVAIVFGVPDVTLSDWELSDCIENCRSTFDPDKDIGSYSDCVENCKRNHADGE